MESIVNSQLMGKWYQIAKTQKKYENQFVETFLYLSMNCNDGIELLYVGIKKNRKKILRNFSLNFFKKKDVFNMVINNIFIKKKLILLFFDKIKGIIIVSDKKMKNITIYSRKDRANIDVVESCLNSIDTLKYNIKSISLYSNKIENQSVT